MKNLVIVGAGGLGREVAAMIKLKFSHQYNFLGFVDDGLKLGEAINGVEVLGNIDWLNHQKEELAVVMAIGRPGLKAILFKRLHNDSLSYPNILDPASSFHEVDKIKMGQGNVVTDRCVFTTNIVMGSFNLFNLNTTVGHDCEIGDFCSIMPGVNLGGGSKLGNEIYVGSGANVIHAVTVGSSSIIGSGAVVNTAIPAGKTYVGVPAKEVKNV